MTGMLPITVVVPVKNEAASIEACLARLGRFSEIIVVDSASTDDTRAIAERMGARVLDFTWDGRYPKKRNWVLLNQPLQNPWVLFLDADEVVDDAFCDEAAKAVQSPTFCGYWLNYRNHFLGRRLRFGVPQRKLALFKVGAGLYERIDEDHWSALDMEVHEHPVILGRIGVIRAPIDHRDDRGILRFIDRHRDYARWEANRAVALKTNTPEGKATHLTARQRIKYSRLAEWWFPFAYFVFQYVAKLGFLDGGAGFHYASYKFWYFTTVRLLISERRLPRTS
jgi:glycosyltransferase involved in cell wall biosynthesis